MCLMCLKRSRRRESDLKSSVASSTVELERNNSFPGAGALSTYDTQNLRQFTILELEHATSNFNQINIMGEGTFGLVYKGLLDDGSLVAVKRHLHQPIQYFVNKVKHIAQVHHKHVLKLIGYCEENYQQLLVYDFLRNGNVGNHIYDGKGLPIGELDMNQRLLIALGAAKGLEHLHSLVPPVLHMHFRTRNVLLDEQFTAKVSDFGLSKLLADDNCASSSSSFDCFLDPELRSLKDFSERSDVYSFGVFLLELISGSEAVGRNQLDMLDNLVLQAKSTDAIHNFIDKTVKDRTADAAEQMMELALMCVDTGAKRPAMKNVVAELERIHESAAGHSQSGRSEHVSVVTLGSDLFK